MKHLLVVAGLLVAVSAGPALAGVIDGSKVNLATLRGNVASVSRASEGDAGVAATRALYPAGGVDSRFVPTETEPAWWQVDFGVGVTHSVQNYEILIYNGAFSKMTYRVETSVDGIQWDDQTGDIALVLPEGATHVPGYVFGSFDQPVDARFVRIVELDFFNTWTGNDSKPGEAIVTWIHLTGPNTFDVNSAISLATPALGIGGTPTMTDLENPTPVEKPGLTNNFSNVSTDNYFWGVQLNVGEREGQFIPAQMTVPLDDVYAISAVALTTLKPEDDRRPTIVEIWISPTADKDDWTKITTVTLADDLYHHEIELDGSFPAQRVRFDVIATLGRECYIPQLYVYGTAVPEPMTMTLLTLGGLALLRRRR